MRTCCRYKECLPYRSPEEYLAHILSGIAYRLCKGIWPGVLILTKLSFCLFHQLGNRVAISFPAHRSEAVFELWAAEGMTSLKISIVTYSSLPLIIRASRPWLFCLECLSVPHTYSKKIEDSNFYAFVRISQFLVSWNILRYGILPVFPAVQSTRLRGRTGRITTHIQSF